MKLDIICFTEQNFSFERERERERGDIPHTNLLLKYF